MQAKIKILMHMLDTVNDTDRKQNRTAETIGKTIDVIMKRITCMEQNGTVLLGEASVQAIMDRIEAIEAEREQGEGSDMTSEEYEAMLQCPGCSQHQHAIKSHLQQRGR